MATEYPTSYDGIYIYSVVQIMCPTMRQDINATGNKDILAYD